jgi:hypothetical protein
MWPTCPAWTLATSPQRSPRGPRPTVPGLDAHREARVDVPEVPGMDAPHEPQRSP